MRTTTPDAARETGWSYDKDNSTWRPPATTVPGPHVHIATDITGGNLPIQVGVPAGDVIAGTFGANQGNGTFSFPGILRSTFAPGTAPAPNRYWDGLELASPNSTPYLDFHRSTNPEEATDYNMRFILDGAGIFHVYGGRFIVDATASVDALSVEGANANLKIGPRDTSAFWALYSNASRLRFWSSTVSGDLFTIDQASGNIFPGPQAFLGRDPSYGNTFAQFSHVNRQAAGQYCVLQGSGGESYMNAGGSGNVVYMRQNNTDIGLFIGTNGDFNRLNLTTGADAGTWDQRVLRLHAPSRPGIAFYHTGNGQADQLCDQGPRVDCLDWAGNGFPSGASSFVTISREATKIKDTIKTLDKKHEHERHKKLRPVRFKRPHASMHVLCRGKGCKECSSEGVPGQINKPFIDKNQDTDFIGFIAEEVAEHFPELINWEPSVEGDWDSEPRPGGIDLGALTAHLTSIVQDIVGRVEALEKKK